jgi:methanethiol S-methyltransferase
MSRTFWNGFGWAAQATFGLMVVVVFLFLRGYEAPPADGSRLDGLIDAGLALQFALPHSTLLLPAVRRRLTKWIPAPMYGAFFCLVASLSLLLVAFCWRPIGGALWNFTGDSRTLMVAGYCGAWVALVYSLHLAGLGYQTGWTTWRPWIRGEPPPERPFRPRSWYRVLRHPVYFSLLGIFWLTPVMSVDRLMLNLVWTAYVYVGSVLKDRRMVLYIGEPYREYQAAVPGYPGMPAGPLARIPLKNARDGSSSVAA